MPHDAGCDILAVVVLLAAAAGLVVWAYAAFRRTQYTLAQAPLYLLNQFMARFLWRAQVHGRLPIADDQGAVIVSNHLGPIDPGFIGLVTNRPVHWMVAREYCEHWFTGWALRILGAIPVNRGGVDTAATKLAIRYAQQGELVGMFPEGRINTTDRLLLPGRPGVTMVAIKAQVPVVPCYITGSPGGFNEFAFLITPSRTRLRVGQPVDLSHYYGRDNDKQVLEEVTRTLLRAIAHLAGDDHFEPELAGRRWKPGSEDGDA